MQISVVIPVYGRNTELDRAIKSVLSQSTPVYELIVVDDGYIGSRTSTFELLEGCNWKYVQLEHNQGVSSARNIGVRASTGSWVAFLDSDDEWLPNKIKEQTTEALNHPSAALVHSDEIWIRNGVRVNQHKKHSQRYGPDLFERSLEMCLISPSSAVMKRSIFDSLGGFNDQMEVCEDFDLWLRLLAKYEVAYVDYPLLKKYGGHEDQLSRKYFGMDLWRLDALSRFSCPESLRSKRDHIFEKKLAVLRKGALKHGNSAILRRARKLESQWRLRPE